MSNLPAVLEKAASEHAKTSRISNDGVEHAASMFIYSLKCLSASISQSGAQMDFIAKYSKQEGCINIAGGLIYSLSSSLRFAEGDALYAHHMRNRAIGYSQGVDFQVQTTHSSALAVQNYVRNISEFYDFQTFYNLPDLLASRLEAVNKALDLESDDVSLNDEPSVVFQKMSVQHVLNKPDEAVNLEEERAFLLYVVEVLSSQYVMLNSEFHDQAALIDGLSSRPSSGGHVTLNITKAASIFPVSFFETFDRVKKAGLLEVEGMSSPDVEPGVAVIG